MFSEESNGSIYPALTLGLCLIIGTIIGSYTFYQGKALNNTLAVTGSAKQAIVSDIVKWNAGFSRTVGTSELKGGYEQMKADQALVIKFFQDNGIDQTGLTVSPVSVEEPNRYDRNQPQEYTLRQSVQIQSTDVQKITDLSKNIQALINQGVIFATQNLEYYYSKLPDLRVNLLTDAIKDAKARAQKIAEASNEKVGQVLSASAGVIQVLSPNSVDISDYGNYDTSSINKEVMVTVKASFSLK